MKIMIDWVEITVTANEVEAGDSVTLRGPQVLASRQVRWTNQDAAGQVYIYLGDGLALVHGPHELVTVERETRVTSDA